ncbi:unnamed protein product [Adineta steineri]|uniref:Integrase zinc-binding domain-containing protein n=1 Tax=Adineta steineri TaxID=433720 RepID=A0A813XBE8_9BILA|nr:unnamed protein product [Adineta steineri]CAF3867652.1 unnamed protein product [Adineta steineri]
MPINSLCSVIINGSVSNPASHSDCLHALILVVTVYIEDALQRELVIELMDQYSLLALEVPLLRQTFLSEVLFAFYDHPSDGQFGRECTFTKLKTRFYWSQMYETINLYIKSYRDYAQHNIRPLKPDEHLEPIAPPTEVFAMVGLDF